MWSPRIKTVAVLSLIIALMTPAHLLAQRGGGGGGGMGGGFGGGRGGGFGGGRGGGFGGYAGGRAGGFGAARSGGYGGMRSGGYTGGRMGAYMPAGPRGAAMGYGGRFGTGGYVGRVGTGGYMGRAGTGGYVGRMGMGGHVGRVGAGGALVRPGEEGFGTRGFAATGSRHVVVRSGVNGAMARPSVGFAGRGAVGRPLSVVAFPHRAVGFVGSPFFGFHGNHFGFVAGSPFFGFPHRFFGFPRPFFGFPHSGFNFFFGFGFGAPFFGAPFFGFPFVSGFTFTGFPFVPGFPFVGSVGHSHHFFGFGGFGFGHFGFGGFGFGGFAPWSLGFSGTPFFGYGLPYAYPAPYYGYPYDGYGYPPGPYGQDTTGAYLDTLAQAAPRPGRHEEVGARPSLGRQLAIAGVAGPAGDSLIVDRVSVRDVSAGSALRLTWRNAGLTSDEVVLFLADSNQQILVAQTLHAPPYSALLEPPSGTAFVGMTVRWPDGTNSTRIVPFKVGQRGQ